MAFSETLARRTRVVLARRKNVEEKRMFGGVGFLLNGNLLVAVRKDTLLVRLGPEEGERAQSEPHVAAFEITGRGKMAGWVVVGLGGIGGDDELKDWLRRAMKFVTTLPAKLKDE